MASPFAVVASLLFIVVLVHVAGSEEGSCHVCSSATTTHHHKLHGTKTTYNTAQRHIIHGPNVTIPSSCQPAMLYLFKRHAIRYPDGEDIPEMEQVLESIKSQILAAHATGKSGLCPKDVENLQKWKINMKPEDDNLVTTSGARETGEIGTSFVNLFHPHMQHNFCLFEQRRGCRRSFRLFWVPVKSWTSQFLTESARIKQHMHSFRNFTRPVVSE